MKPFCLAFCAESAPGVFEREWTKANVRLDCNDFSADIKMKEADAGAG